MQKFCRYCFKNNNNKKKDKKEIKIMMRNALKAPHLCLSCFPDCTVANEGCKSSKKDPPQGAKHLLFSNKSCCLGFMSPFGIAPKHRTTPGLYI